MDTGTLVTILVVALVVVVLLFLFRAAGVGRPRPKLRPLAPESRDRHTPTTSHTLPARMGMEGVPRGRPAFPAPSADGRSRGRGSPRAAPPGDGFLTRTSTPGVSDAGGGSAAEACLPRAPLETRGGEVRPGVVDA